jgi:hypothetical protein
MTADSGVTRARRYLLGQVDESTAGAFEDSFFRDDQTLEQAEAAEDELIEDYLGRRLSADERARFEQHYLAAPHHGVRVETVRRLIAAAPGHSRRRPYFVPLAAAAALMLAVGTWWLYSSRHAPDTVDTRIPPPASRDRNLPASTPLRVFATSLSPITLRSAASGSAVVIPEGTDVVSLRLLGEEERPRSAAARAFARTVAGETVWQGEATLIDLPAGAAARVDIPASVLRPDDYIVELRTGPAGADRESYRYVLRVRSKP